MKFQFEPDLDYQHDAIAAVCDLFRGQEVCRSEFAVAHRLDETGTPGLEESARGVGNRLTLVDETILSNLRQIQLRNRLSPAPDLDSLDFTVEMETGTGKTYVYLRTIFELNQRYGFTKFAIVVPSVAIKEGVNKSLEMMGEHFRALYAGVPFEHFIYDSAKLGQVRNFATSPQIQIMVMTVGAINKRDINTIYQDNEKTGGDAPIDLVQATNPIIIVDEPQSVDGGLEGRGREALGRMNPLCTLRYSATHADKYHMVYRLDAVDAYEQKLVKQIEVAAGTIVDDHNRPYVRLLSTRRQRSVISAKVEIDVATPSGRVQRQEIFVQDGEDLQLRTRREIYRDHYIGEITVGRGNESLELRLPGNERWLTPGEAYGAVEQSDVHREMIRKAIREHLDKEKRLHPQGIKVLTLFFIDKVANYRNYDADGNPVKGQFAVIFEEEYRRSASHRDYRTLFDGVDDLGDAAERAHEGYFSIDRRGGWTDTAENNQTNRDNAERAYNLIMRHKEKLLSFDEPLKFIFSHSALREGWDNPNVFQICALRDIQTERERRQTIGRGLRLCVNQDGERQRGFEMNTLTVIAQESYEDFAENLQREIEEETGIRFGVVEEHQFALVVDENGPNGRMGVEKSKELRRYLVTNGYLNLEGKVTDALREALQNNTLALPDEFEPMREAITEALRKATGRIEIKNAAERRTVQPREAVLDSEDFKALWERIKYHTTYRVRFDNDNLLKECAEALSDAPFIPSARLQWNTAGMRLEQGGVQSRLLETGAPVRLRSDDVELPDLLTELQDRTQLTRRSIARILSDSGRLDGFRINPQKFIEMAAEAINRCKRSSLVDGVKYRRLGDEHYYAQELFVKEELGHLNKMIKSKRSPYDYVKWDSTNERNFADQLELSDAVRVYAKLPSWFKVPTPLGTYNPDWAVLIKNDDHERLYFVAETKGTSSSEQLRHTELAKVNCGRKHFVALAVGESPAKYCVVQTLDELLAVGLHERPVPDQETFERLADEWTRDRPRGVDIAHMTKHPAYQRIIAMGEPAVPWLLNRLAMKPDHWFVALSAITGAKPVPPESRGRVKEMAKAWLDWGNQQGYELETSDVD